MRAFALVFTMIVLATSSAASAADVAPLRPAALTGVGRALPFPRSPQSQSVWASGVCWNECGSACTWGLVGCLERDSQGRCLRRTDHCDRYCQNQCRTRGGPLLPDPADF